MKARPLSEGKIAVEDMAIFTLTDDIDEAVQVIIDRHERHAEELASQRATEKAQKSAERASPARSRT